MSPRKRILRALSAASPGANVRPSEIAGFDEQAPRYREAVNGLLREQLISGSRDGDGDLVIGLNPKRLPQVRREIRPWFRAPLAWALVLGLAGGAALLLS